MDYLQIKKILLAEYEANGGRNTREFLRGMNYLEDYLESGRNDHHFNADVDDLLFLRMQNKKLQDKVTELKNTLKNKQVTINQYHAMNKTEKQKFRASQELVRIEMAYSRMIVELEERYKRKRFKTTDKGNANEKPHPKGMKIKTVRTFK